MQSVALKIALYILFDLNPMTVEESAIGDIALSVNELWQLSKTQHGRIEDQNVLRMQKLKLQHALVKIFPDFLPGSDPRKNPLNLILPAFETLWRVVFFYFIEVNFRESRPAQTKEWRGTLGDFLRHDVEKSAFESLKAQFGRRSASAKDIVNEALRLYAPTRRIYRQYHLESAPRPTLLTADIEKLHRDSNIWGQDSLTFKPSRWQHLPPEAEKAFMPFGNKPFVCPAQKEFGPKIIGILVAALTTYIKPSEWHLEFCRSSESSPETLTENEQLATDRKAYHSWAIYGTA